MPSSSSTTRSTAEGAGEVGGGGGDVPALLRHSLLSAGQKRISTKDSSEEKDEELEDTYMGYGRTLGRLCSTFISIDACVLTGINHDSKDTDDEGTNRQKTAASVRTSRMISTYEQICLTIPNFREDILTLAGDKIKRRAVCRMISEGMKNSRGDDTSGLKSLIKNYLNVEPTEPLQGPPIPDGNKSIRGFNHPVTAKLLCPLKYPATQETYNEIKAGRKPVTAALLPRFLFPEDQVYDADDIEKGVCMGHILPRVAKHILQGPSTVFLEPGARRGSNGNAALMNLTEMSPEIITYIACQTRFALSSSGSWSQREGHFDYEEFYWNIVEFLQGDESGAVVRLFNHHVFGDPEPDDDASQEQEVNVESVESDFDLLTKQRERKRIRAAEALKAQTGNVVEAGDVFEAGNAVEAGNVP